MSGTTSIIGIQTAPCTYCGKTSMVDLERDKYRRWKSGEHVQVVWPEMSPDEREMLITGIHPACWDSMFRSA